MSNLDSLYNVIKGYEKDMEKILKEENEKKSRQDFQPYLYNPLTAYKDISIPLDLIENTNVIIFIYKNCRLETIRLENPIESNGESIMLKSKNVVKDHDYYVKNTAYEICDPWKDYSLDHDDSEMVKYKKPSIKKHTKYRHIKHGVKQPEIPILEMPLIPVKKNKNLSHDDTAMLRKVIKDKYSNGASQNIQHQYEQTKEYFYSTGLDQFTKYSKNIRRNMRAVYFAYLQNNEGSKKAIKECIKNSPKK
ncbi:hypothetical protein A3Q56_04121 [Intoshia linei]|uniref:Uncharacterized protein n=1 Tax=Intoshia linei TaxID=1819745 RepID=A0A177B3B7_9BILA|nr:hypothetical protein A3Q56_04121 [Intoshia linei]